MPKVSERRVDFEEAGREGTGECVTPPNWRSFTTRQDHSRQGTRRGHCVPAIQALQALPTE